MPRCANAAAATTPTPCAPKRPHHAASLECGALTSSHPRPAISSAARPSRRLPPLHTSRSHLR
eukprot:5933977-Prymnesium_polylepis.1